MVASSSVGPKTLRGRRAAAVAGFGSFHHGDGDDDDPHHSTRRRRRHDDDDDDDDYGSDDIGDTTSFDDLCCDDTCATCENNFFRLHIVPRAYRCINQLASAMAVTVPATTTTPITLADDLIHGSVALVMMEEKVNHERDAKHVERSYGIAATTATAATMVAPPPISSSSSSSSSSSPTTMVDQLIALQPRVRELHRTLSDMYHHGIWSTVPVTPTSTGGSDIAANAEEGTMIGIIRAATRVFDTLHVDDEHAARFRRVVTTPLPTSSMVFLDNRVAWMTPPPPPAPAVGYGWGAHAVADAAAAIPIQPVAIMHAHVPTTTTTTSTTMVHWSGSVTTTPSPPAVGMMMRVTCEQVLDVLIELQQLRQQLLPLIHSVLYGHRTIATNTITTTREYEAASSAAAKEQQQQQQVVVAHEVAMRCAFGDDWLLAMHRISTSHLPRMSWLPSLLPPVAVHVEYAYNSVLQQLQQVRDDAEQRVVTTLSDLIKVQYRDRLLAAIYDVVPNHQLTHLLIHTIIVKQYLSL